MEKKKTTVKLTMLCEVPDEFYAENMKYLTHHIDYLISDEAQKEFDIEQIHDVSVEIDK